MCPWVDLPPAEIVRDHIRRTVQPSDAPPNPSNGGSTIRVPMLYCFMRPIFRIGSLTTHEALPPGSPDSLRRKYLVGNPAASMSTAHKKDNP
jgi:uncharacterized protein